MHDILRLPEIAEMTGVPISTPRYYRQIGKGPRMFKLGGRVVARRSDVAEWIEAQRALTDGRDTGRPGHVRGSRAAVIPATLSSEAR